MLMQSLLDDKQVENIVEKTHLGASSKGFFFCFGIPLETHMWILLMVSTVHIGAGSYQA